MSAPRQLVMWETETTTEPSGAVRLVAKKPLCRMSIAQAAKLLGCTTWTVSRLYQDGLITGWKPGANPDPARARRDGRKSNAKVVLDAGSVLRHKAAVTQTGYLDEA